ncbi:MAG: hypothetical protein EB075_13480 [Bacteroidetes bacterium]|nr:hypothetical protein [Bacteroidota bacterium]
MVYDAVDLCNRALLMLGVAPLHTWDDTTPEAEVVRAFYPTIRDGVLVAHPWSFATRTAVFETDHPELGDMRSGDLESGDLEESTDHIGTKGHTETDPHFPYRVPLPSRCVRVIAVSRLGGFRSRGAAAVPYRVIGSTLVCPLVPVSIEYIEGVPEAVFPTFFSAVVSTRLAAALCLPLTENTHRADHLTRMAERELHHARCLDAGSQPPPVLASSVLLDVRQ